MNSRWQLSGKRALVTGGTKGIGAAVAAELRLLGASVALVARNADDIATQTADGVYTGLAADLATPEGRDATLAFVAQQWGGLDILINNVGTNIRKPSLDYTPDEWTHLFATNLTSAWELCRAAYPLLSANGDGSIVNIGSVAGSTMVGSGGPYAITKAALDHLCHYLAVEWATVGVRVNNVNPWYTNTELAAPVLNDPERAGRILARTPNGRLAEPEDIAGLVAFLCLPVARHITGQCIAVDGGYLSDGRF